MQIHCRYMHCIAEIFVGELFREFYGFEAICANSICEKLTKNHSQTLLSGSHCAHVDYYCRMYRTDV